MKMKIDIKYSNKWLEFIEIEDSNGATMSGTRCYSDGIAVLPYKLNANKEISHIGVNFECNPLWGPGLHLTCVTGGIEEGESPFIAILRELEEEAGLKALNKSVNINLLGTFRLSKINANIQYLALIEINEQFQSVEIVGDGTVNEKLSEFKWLSIEDFENQLLNFPQCALTRMLFDILKNK